MPKLIRSEEYLVNTLTSYNAAYRAGAAVVPDEYYDKLEAELRAMNPDNPFLKKVGGRVPMKDREKPLPFVAAEMPKLTTFEAFKKWLANNPDSEYVISGKYDGASLVVEEGRRIALSKGDGITGADVTNHLAVTEGVGSTVVVGVADYSYGEYIFSKQAFKKYAHDYSTSRSLIVGKMRNDLPEDVLEDATYIRYGIHQTTADIKTAASVLVYLNKKYNKVYKVRFSVVNKSYFNEADTEKNLKQIYTDISEEFDLDGLVITGNHTKVSAAYKVGFDAIVPVKVKHINWQVTKNGYLKPVMVITPTLVDGARITNVFIDNAATVIELGIGTGAVVNIKRSGKVIPRVVSVKKRVTATLPVTCPSCGDAVYMEHIELHCKNPKCPAQVSRQVNAFFNIIGVDKVGGSTSDDLAKFSPIPNIVDTVLNEPNKLLALDGWGISTVETLQDNLRKALRVVPLPTLQHASGYFSGLGSSRLRIINSAFGKRIPSKDAIMVLEGFSNILADVYLGGIAEFGEFYKALERITPICVYTKTDKLVSTKLSGITIVFTGYRDSQLEQVITANGGNIGSSVTKKTTYLVAKGDTSSKYVRAVDLGIPIFTGDTFKTHIAKKYGVT